MEGQRGIGDGQGQGNVTGHAPLGTGFNQQSKGGQSGRVAESGKCSYCLIHFHISRIVE